MVFLEGSQWWGWSSDTTDIGKKNIDGKKGCLHNGSRRYWKRT